MRTISDRETPAPVRPARRPDLLAPEPESFAEGTPWSPPEYATLPTSQESPTQTWRDHLLMATIGGIVRHRVFACLLFILCVTAAGLNTLRQDPYYVATATIFPATSDSGVGALGIAGIANLMGNLGVSTGGSSQFPIYENVVHSDRLIVQLLDMPVTTDKRTLLEHLEIVEPDKDMQKLLGIAAVRDNLTYDTDKKTGLVMISYLDRDPKVAAAVANRVLELLNDFDVSTTANQARERLKFVEARLAEARDNLQQAESKLEDFGNDNLRIGRAPELLLEQARLEREVTIQQEVYLALRKEAEMARIDEQRTVPVINVLDHAAPPPVPAGPSLVKNLMLGAIMGVALVVVTFGLVSLSPRQLLGRLMALGAQT